MPLWTGIFAVVTSTCTATMPRSEYVMLGMPTSMFSVSQTTITSDLSRSLVDLEELQQVLRADLLLALDQHLDVDRQRVAGLAVGGDGPEERGDGALVVGRRRGRRAGRRGA